MIRKKIGIPLGVKIPSEQLDLISDHFHVGYFLWNQNYELIRQNTFADDPNNFINIMLLNEHYYIAEVVTHVNCRGCGLWINTARDHKCDIKSKSYKQRQIKKEFNMVKVETINDTLPDFNKMVHFDLETFPNPKNNCHVPYACGWFDTKYSVTYGEKCFDNLVDLLCQQNSKTISAYNGSGFDTIF